jgi:uncharacterized phage infection (PIP) family protein YhgE
LFAGISSRVKRRKVIEGFQQEVQKGHDKLEEEVSSNLKAYIKNLKSKIEDNFGRFDLMLEKEAAQLKSLQAEHQTVQAQLSAVAKEIGLDEEE